MSPHGFNNAFAAELDAYVAFKEKMGFYGRSRVWYLKRFDTYCAEGAPTDLPSSPEGPRVALFYTKLQKRLLSPLLEADKLPAPTEKMRRALILIQSEKTTTEYVTNPRSDGRLKLVTRPQCQPPAELASGGIACRRVVSRVRACSRFCSRPRNTCAVSPITE